MTVWGDRRSGLHETGTYIYLDTATANVWYGPTSFAGVSVSEGPPSSGCI